MFLVGGNEIFGQKYFFQNHIFNAVSHEFEVCDFRKIIFGEKFEQKGTFRGR
jgi:hypothetical protein